MDLFASSLLIINNDNQNNIDSSGKYLSLITDEVDAEKPIHRGKRSYIDDVNESFRDWLESVGVVKGKIMERDSTV